MLAQPVPRRADSRRGPINPRLGFDLLFVNRVVRGWGGDGGYRLIAVAECSKWMGMIRPPLRMGETMRESSSDCRGGGVTAGEQQRRGEQQQQHHLDADPRPEEEVGWWRRSS